jgi:DNA repair protein RadC
MTQTQATSIRLWPEDMRPRERLLKFGAESLNDAELLAIFIRTGTKKRNAVELSYDILQHCGGLKGLFSSRLEDFDQLAGLGLSKWSQLQAAQEIVRRAHYAKLHERPLLKSQASTREFLQSSIGLLDHEVFACFFLDYLGYLIEFKILFRGGIDQTLVYPREIVKEALQRNASAVILVHNHPNGLAEPSQADKLLTKTLKKILNSIEIKVLDHMIVTHCGYYSFLDAKEISFDN